MERLKASLIEHLDSVALTERDANAFQGGKLPAFNIAMSSLIVSHFARFGGNFNIDDAVLLMPMVGEDANGNGHEHTDQNVCQ